MEAGPGPVQLAALLRREFGVGAAVTVVARTGWTTDELWAATAQADLRPPYDLVANPRSPGQDGVVTSALPLCLLG